MRKNKMKCFYHSADLDGHCSGAIIKQKYPKCELIGINYGEKFPWKTINKGEEVFMVDFSLQPFEEMNALNELCNFHWIDHHKSAIEEAYKIKFQATGGQILDKNFAGCELTWKYINGNKQMPDAVYLLGRYDVWKHSEDERSLAFQYGMRRFDTNPDNVEFWKPYLQPFSLKIAKAVHDGKKIYEYQVRQYKILSKTLAFETEISGKKAICMNAGLINSQAFDSVFNPEKHDLMLSFYRKEGEWHISLYSTKDDVDCSVIAKSFDGGGHKGASGFQCKELPFKI